MQLLAASSPSQREDLAEAAASALAAAGTSAPARTSALNPALDSALIRLTRSCLRQSSFKASALSFCTDLALLTGAARVTLGWLENDECSAVAVSNSGATDLESEQDELLRSAFHEAIDQRCTLQFPAPAGRPPGRRILRAQEALVRASQGSVLTVPLVAHAQPTGALIAEFAAIDPITQDAVQLCEQAGAVVAPLLYLVREREAPWYRRLRASPVAIGARARRRMWRYIGAACAAALLAAAVVPVRHMVSAPARIEGEVQRVVASPAKGYLKTVQVRPGDTVRAGQLLAELGERDLELERHKLKSEVAQHEGAAVAALAKGDRAGMAMSQAKTDGSRAQLGLVDHQLEQVQLTAPIDGVLIQGDLAQSVGMPVDRGQSLFTIAPVNRYRVIVELGERDIRAARVGQTGELALSALPWDTMGITVQRIAPMANVVENRNVFELEATLAEAASDIRPGLRGTAHLDAGDDTLLSIWGTRLVNTVKRWTWRWQI